MQVAGIVCEYNPLHSGHAWHLEQTRAMGADAVVCVMSGHFVQRGDAALLDKWTRAACAVAAGANLVLELPSRCALLSAEGFAESAVRLLLAAGVDAVSFGSECGDAGALLRTAELLCSPAFEEAMQPLLRERMPYAAARQRALEALGGDGALLRAPNNILGVEYCKALLRHGAGERAVTLPRRGAGHDAQESGGFTSASAIRGALLRGDGSALEAHTPPAVLPLVRRALEQYGAADLRRLERALLAHLRRQTAQDFLALPDVSAGLEHRIQRICRSAASVEEIVEQGSDAMTTRSRVRRILLRSFLRLPRAAEATRPRYLRVLAFDDTGRQLLKGLKNIQLPVITRPAAHAALLAEEAALTDLFALCYELPRPGGLELRSSPRHWSRG